jgi:hypothetical protein
MSVANNELRVLDKAHSIVILDFYKGPALLADARRAAGGTD